MGICGRNPPILQRLQNRVLCTIINFSRRTSVRDLHVAFQISNVCDYITKLCRQQADAIQNHDNETVRNIEARHRKYKSLKLGSDHVNDRSCIQIAVVGLATWTDEILVYIIYNTCPT
jgi:hypothetical protein